MDIRSSNPKFNVLGNIILLTRNSISSKSAMPWSHLHLELSQNFLFQILKSVIEHTTRHSLMYKTDVKFQSCVRHQFYNFCTEEERIYSQFLDRSSIFFVIMLENNNIFKLINLIMSIYLNIYFFSCVGILPARSIEASLLRTLNLQKHLS